jgi:hypothetical protein
MTASVPFLDGHNDFLPRQMKTPPFKKRPVRALHCGRTPKLYAYLPM